VKDNSLGNATVSLMRWESDWPMPETTNKRARREVAGGIRGIQRPAGLPPNLSFSVPGFAKLEHPTACKTRIEAPVTGVQPDRATAPTYQLSNRRMVTREVTGWANFSQLFSCLSLGVSLAWLHFKP